MQIVKLPVGRDSCGEDGPEAWAVQWPDGYREGPFYTRAEAATIAAQPQRRTRADLLKKF